MIESEGQHAEVAANLGVTESRISQIRSRLKKEVVDAAVIEERYAEYRDDPDSSKLLVRWIKL